MGFCGTLVRQVYDHYLTRGVQVGLFGYDVRQRYRHWGRDDTDPSGPARRVAIIVGQVIRSMLFK